MSEAQDQSLTLSIEILPAFKPFLQPARYKAAFGGRGSGKSHFFAGNALWEAYRKPTRIVCIREIQNSIRDSVKQLLADKIDAWGMSHMFTVLDTEIRGHNGSNIIFRGMQSFNADSIKSLEGYDIAWVEEAHTLSQRSLDLLRPTIRKEGSEIWFSWNPESEFDPVDMMFRGKNPPADAVIRKVNWDDNFWMPDVLRREMEHDRQADPAKAAYVWDGDYRAAPAGAYYADLLAKSLTDGRIGRVQHDPSAEVHVSFDLGVGQNMALVFSQWVGREVRIIEALQGDEQAANEGLAWYARKMRERPYTYAPIIFPHDGRVREHSGFTRAGFMEGLGFKVDVLPMTPVDDGIEAVKRMLPMTWIDAMKCADAMPAWKAYRENWDEKLRRSNGPLKDWTNHFADSLRYTALAYEAPRIAQRPKVTGYHHGEGWMG